MRSLKLLLPLAIGLLTLEAPALADKTPPALTLERVFASPDLSGGEPRKLKLSPDGKLVKGDGSSTVGWRASGVPGTVAGFALAFEKYGSGRLSWSEVVAPALRLAREGHTVSQATAASLQREIDLLQQFPASKRIFLHDGALWQPGFSGTST